VLQQHPGGCVWLASYDFLLVFYSDLGLGGTVVELQAIEVSNHNSQEQQEEDK